MRRRWILALMIVWIAVRLVWYIPWLLGSEQPSPGTVALIMGVLDLVVFIVVVVDLFRSAVPRTSGDGE